MAATARIPVRRILRIARAIIGWAALALGAYFLAGWIGSSLPAHRGFTQAPASDPDAVTIMIGTNGVHTTIIVPVENEVMDWRGVFPPSDLQNPSRPYTHIGISWGQREVFLDTPTWADLSPWLVLRVVALGGGGLYHAEHFVNPQPNADYRTLRISAAQYRALVRALIRDMPRGALWGAGRKAYPGYGANDAFYDAGGTYTAYTTCNEWTGETLRRAGIRTGAWTPFAGSVMKWVPDTE